MNPIFHPQVNVEGAYANFLNHVNVLLCNY